jgi:uncharacterized protein (TIGR04222 family)
MKVLARTGMASALAVIAVLSFALTAHAAISLTGPEPGKRVYDTAGVLSPSEIKDLETRAQALTNAGAPCIVYLQARSATRDQTRQDAQNLMTAWDIESKPGARDGFVMYFNLQPGNLKHGQAFLFAGQKHVNGGALPESKLQRTYDEVMAPLLLQGKVAQAIAAGLDAVTHDLTTPLPGQSANPWLFERLPANIIAFLLAILAYLAWRWVRDGAHRLPAKAERATPPNDLAPALAGAIVRGRLTRDLLQATLFDMARQDLIELAYDEDDGVVIRLNEHHKQRVEPDAEHAIWSLLEHSHTSEGAISAKDLRKNRAGWGQVEIAIRKGLYSRHWFDSRFFERRRLLYALAIVASVVAFFAFFSALTGEDAWGLIGLGALIGVAVGCVVLALWGPETTPKGEAAAAQWRGYLRGLEEAARNPDEHVDLDEALPYAVALGARRFLAKRFASARDHGDAPSYLGLDRIGKTASAVPLWRSIDRSLRPPLVPAYQQRWAIGLWSGFGAGGHYGGGAGGGGGGGAGGGGGGAGGGGGGGGGGF